MCGIAGWFDCKKDLTNETEVLQNMCDALTPRGPDAQGLYVEKNIGLVHRRLAVVDLENGKQPMTKIHNGAQYTIVYNGELYNTAELRKELKRKGVKFVGTGDTEVLLWSFIIWGEKCLEKLNGIFAFAVWNNQTQKLFAARDRMGVKPFFYRETQNGLIFASEIKSLFKNPNCPAVLDADGINQIFLLAPGRIPGSGVFKNISELLPGEFFWADFQGIKKQMYFKLTARTHPHNLKKTIRHLRKLVTDAIKRQLVSDVPLATFLSGGLDSSIITHIAAKKYKRERKTLTTYSVDFDGNDKNFIPSIMQPDRDEKYIALMSKHARTNHNAVILDNTKVFSALNDAALARDLAGMADVDSSLLLFARHVKNNHTVVLSGECADEIFGGYPWFFDKTPIQNFPWARSLDMRRQLINPKYSIESPEKYVEDLYKTTINNAEILPDECETDTKMRQLTHLNMQWFMQTLLDRKDRMTMATGLEVRVPFCDHRIAEYAYNIPWQWKALDGREKGLLRRAFRGILPDEIVYRKKAPYPKSFDPQYFENVRAAAVAAVNSGGVLSHIINRDYFNTLLTLEPQTPTPWYGQLMRLPQLFAMIAQMDCIFRTYNVKLV
jgi:asparagine synthase (glutamine-hydrolysing)